MKRRRNGKDQFVVCTKLVYKDPGTRQFTCPFFHIWTKTPVSSRFFWIVFDFWGLEPK